MGSIGYMGYTGRRWRGGWASDAQGSNTVASPYLHRGSAARARGVQEPFARLGRCAGFGRWGKSAGADIGVNYGTALKGGRARVRPGQRGRRQNCSEAQSQRRYLAARRGFWGSDSTLTVKARRELCAKMAHWRSPSTMPEPPFPPPCPLRIPSIPPPHPKSDPKRAILAQFGVSR